MNNKNGRGDGGLTILVAAFVFITLFFTLLVALT